MRVFVNSFRFLSNFRKLLFSRRNLKKTAVFKSRLFTSKIGKKISRINHKMFKIIILKDHLGLYIFNKNEHSLTKKFKPLLNLNIISFRFLYTIWMQKPGLSHSSYHSWLLETSEFLKISDKLWFYNDSVFSLFPPKDCEVLKSLKFIVNQLVPKRLLNFGKKAH